MRARIFPPASGACCGAWRSSARSRFELRPPSKSAEPTESRLTRAQPSLCRYWFVRGPAPALWQLERGRHRHVVGGAQSAAQALANLQIGDPVGECWRNPDMIEAAALVRGLPIGRAVAPPGVELGRLGHAHAHGVDPATGLLHADELLALDRRMRDDARQLLVAPDIVLERRHIEIADQDRALLRPRPQARL